MKRLRFHQLEAVLPMDLSDAAIDTRLEAIKMYTIVKKHD